MAQTAKLWRTNRSQKSLRMVARGSKNPRAADWDGEEVITRKLGRGDYEKRSRRAYHRCLMCWSFGWCLSRSAYETHSQSTLSVGALVLDLVLCPTRFLSRRPAQRHFYGPSC